jgi:hypothetical protein
VSPVEHIDGPFLMRHEPLAGVLGERRKSTKISSRSTGVLHHPPEACDGIELETILGWEEVEAHNGYILNFAGSANAALVSGLQ